MLAAWLRVVVVVCVWAGAMSAAPAARAQAAELQQDAQAWVLLTAQGAMGRGPGLYFLEVQPRSSLARQGPYQTLLRGAIGLQATPWLSLWAGAGFMPGHDGETLVRLDEGRLWQQMTLSGQFFGVGLQSRSRLEQRALAGLPALAYRGRTLARAAIPLLGPVYLPLWDEIFFNFGDVVGGPQRGFDQNRAFAGLGFRPAPDLALEAGYLNRVTPVQMDHTLFVWLMLTP